MLVGRLQDACEADRRELSSGRATYTPAIATDDERPPKMAANLPHEVDHLVSADVLIVNLDGRIDSTARRLKGDGSGPAESDDIRAFIAGWLTTGHVTQFAQVTHGDLNFDGATNLRDWYQLVQSYPGAAALDFAALLSRTNVPEASAFVPCILPLALAGRLRRRTAYRGAARTEKKWA